jgi:hypothetical protein
MFIIANIDIFHTDIDCGEIPSDKSILFFAIVSLKAYKIAAIGFILLIGLFILQTQPIVSNTIEENQEVPFEIDTPHHHLKVYDYNDVRIITWGT